VSTVASPRAASFDGGEGYAIAREPFPFGGAKRFANQLRWSRSLVSRCRAGVDVMHCGNLRPSGYAVRIAAARTGVPYVTYTYGGDVLREIEKSRRSALKRRSARSILGHSSGIVAISDWTAAETRRLLREVGAGEPPLAVIELGTDPVRYNAANDRGRLRARLGLGDAPLLLTVARLVPHKGQDVAIRALARLAGELPALRYLVIGDGADAPRLRALAGELGVGDRVVLAGALPDEDVAEAYATATLYVGLSRVDAEVNVEGFGLSFVEAGASGVPSVAGDSGGVRSAVRDGRTGIVVPPTDVEAVSAAVRRLLADAELRRRMGAEARRAVETHYNWDRVARDVLAFARDVTTTRREGRR
jgi:glycosyltransferase involved in cell wall biosynthesis